MWNVHTVGQAGVKLSPPRLYYLAEFKGGGGDVAVTINPIIQLCLTDASGHLQTQKTKMLRTIITNYYAHIGYKKHIMAPNSFPLL